MQKILTEKFLNEKTNSVEQDAEKKSCEEYLNSLKDSEERVYFDQSNLLIERLHCMHCAQILDDKILAIRYDSKNLTQIQRELLEEMQIQGDLASEWCLDISELLNKNL